MSDEKRERGFVVIDKRGGSGEAEAEAPPAPAEETRAAPKDEDAGLRELPKPDFSALLVSLGTSVLYQLGIVDDPATGEKGEPNLPAARQTIDMIEMLQEKTRGNLDAEEERLLQSLLTDLRMRVVEAGR